MNRRTLKKHCKRAVEKLIAKHGYKREQFVPADGDESIYAPTNMEPRFARNGFIEPGALKGTPIYWYRSSYEYDEWDVKLPTELLYEIEMWENFEPSADDIAQWDAWADEQNAALALAAASHPPTPPDRSVDSASR